MLNPNYTTYFHRCLFAPADSEQCKYGKNRVEADAKRLQTKEEELMKRKNDIRTHLTQLKKERRDLRTAVEAAAGERRLEGESLLMRRFVVARKVSTESSEPGS